MACLGWGGRGLSAVPLPACLHTLLLRLCGQDNVLEGEFAHYCALGSTNGHFGNGASCPGAAGQQEDCAVLPTGQRVCCTVDFVDNWLHMPNASSRQNCQGAYSTKKHDKGQWHGGNESGDVFVPVGAPLPAAAAAIAAAAGPRGGV